MIWIIIEALLALALLVGVIIWVALPAQKRRQPPALPPAAKPENTPTPPPQSGESKD